MLHRGEHAGHRICPRHGHTVLGNEVRNALVRRLRKQLRIRKVRSSILGYIQIRSSLRRLSHPLGYICTLSHCHSFGNLLRIRLIGIGLRHVFHLFLFLILIVLGRIRNYLALESYGLGLVLLGLLHDVFDINMTDGIDSLLDSIDSLGGITAIIQQNDSLIQTLAEGAECLGILIEGRSLSQQSTHVLHRRDELLDGRSHQMNSLPDLVALIQREQGQAGQNHVDQIQSEQERLIVISTNELDTRLVKPKGIRQSLHIRRIVLHGECRLCHIRILDAQRHFFFPSNLFLGIEGQAILLGQVSKLGTECIINHLECIHRARHVNHREIPLSNI